MIDHPVDDLSCGLNGAECLRHSSAGLEKPQTLRAFKDQTKDLPVMHPLALMIAGLAKMWFVRPSASVLILPKATEKRAVLCVTYYLGYLLEEVLLRCCGSRR
mmetsp:Transcript_34514/g.77541  ORF Transcript_34514/g.77541 Transcript_34514/m.77541 type:complete len:103 (+) Transcript_34514:1028-1336(+)